MRNKAITLLTITALVLGVSACGKKDVTSVVSEVTSVTEKVQETNTSIADKIDNINVDEKTDLSNLPEIEVPDVPEVAEEAEKVEAGEVVAMTEEEFNNAIDEYMDLVFKSNPDAPEPTDENGKKIYVGSYILFELASNESLQSVTLGDYFGENYNMIPNALSKDETIKEYADAENAFGYYSMDRGMAEILDPNKYAGQKELTVEDFHRDKELTQKWISFDF